MTAKGSHRILFLYSELAGYFLACARELGGAEWVEAVRIIHWPVNPEAPFEFGSTDEYELIDKSGLDRGALEKSVADFNLTALVCSGWMDSDYNRIARQWQPNIPVVDLRQLVDWLPEAAPRGLDFPLLHPTAFQPRVVPGETQLAFARKLGFPDEHTATGFYCADRALPQSMGGAQKSRAAKKILYIGRYLPVKGCKSFGLPSRHFRRLPGMGTSLHRNRRFVGGTHDSPKIIHHTLQPHELTSHLIDAAAFVMPSKKEPWGWCFMKWPLRGCRC